MCRNNNLKTFKHIISGIVWSILGLYVLLVLLLHIPATQRFIASETSHALEKKLGTKVTIGRVDLGLFNRIIIDDATIYDQQRKPMVQASRLSAKVSLYPLVHGKVSISSAQLFGFQGYFYKESANSVPNYQFALDSLASKDTTSHTPLNLQINSLIVRHGRLKYDQYDVVPTKEKLNPGHLDVQGISAHIIVPQITDDHINVTVKKLAFKEASGLELKKLALRFEADKEKAVIKDFTCLLPRTHLSADSIWATYQNDNEKPDFSTIQYGGHFKNNSIVLADLKSLEPSLGSFVKPLALSTSFSGNRKNLNIGQFNIKSEDDGIDIKLSADIRDISSNPMWLAHISNFNISANSIEHIAKNVQGKKVELPQIATRLGRIGFKGDVGGRGSDISLEGKLGTDAGISDLEGTFDGNHFTLSLKTDAINLKRILDDNKFGQLATNIHVEGKLKDKGLPNIMAKGTIARMDYNNYSYRNINIDGSFINNTFDGEVSMDDPNGMINIQGTACISKKNPSSNFMASIRNLNPKALRLFDKLGDAVINADIDTDISGSSLNNLNGTVNINDLSVDSEKSNLHLDSLQLTAQQTTNGNSLTLDSDFGHINVDGKFDYTTITQSITNFIASKLPTLPGLPQATNERNNDFTITADIYQSEWLNSFVDLPINILAPIHLEGSMNDHTHQMNLNATLPNFTYNDGSYENAIVNLLTSEVDEMVISGHVRKMMGNGHKLDLNFNANGGNNKLITSINWNNNRRRPMKGTFNCSTEFFKNEEGKSAAHIRVHPSEILVNDTAWHILPSDIIYSDKNLIVDYLAIVHNKQHIIVSGKATENPDDSLIVDLQDIDVGYILNIVNFHAVAFNGKASGKASIKSAFGTPKAYADLIVKNFTFEEGRMGTLYAKANYNNELEQINIDAQAIDGKEGRTLVHGYVSPARDYIDLKITANNTRMEFLESFCESFMDNVEARGKGELQLTGDLDEMNLTGMVVANGELDITSINTRYNLDNDTIRMIPNHIIFSNDTIRDRNGNIGIMNGMLNHEHLTRLTFDLNIEAQHLLCYDFHSYGDNTFYGTVYASGNCSIRSRSGSIDFDISGTPEKGSFIEYNAASPDAITDQQFITWRDKSTLIEDSVASIRSAVNDSEEEEEEIDIPSDLHINFLINATPDFTLRLLMDKTSGDYIALNGTGAIRASFYNKGAFDMFGTYLVDHGIYKLTIQNIIKKDFQFQQGGTIVFGGNPYQAALNLSAVYTVNGVPLSDLQIGNSFSSNNIRVDCLMNITGTAESPHVEFDLDLPTVNADAKQMVRSVINGEEEMNQQVIYLLSIGRFYTLNANNAEENQNQTSLAMQSLLSGTISQQINNVLSSFVNNNNWNFGANISTGTEGWNNAEYEGLLSGRLLNNRLLINGQFGYRDNANATTSFIGDFDIRYLLFPNGNLAIKVYNQTNDRYFTRNSLNTQGVGLIMKKDFNSWREFFRRSSKSK